MPTPVRYPSGVSTAAKNSVFFNMPTNDPTKLITYFNDFVQDPLIATADWTATLTGTTPTYALTDGHGGQLLLTTTGAENDGLNLQKKGEFWLPDPAKKFWFKTRLKISDLTESDFVVGMCITDTTLLGAAAGDGVTDGVFFQKDDGSGSVFLLCQKDATTGQLTTAGVHTMVADTFVSLGYYYDGNRYLKYYINDVHTGTADLTATVATYLPDTELTLSIAFLTGAAAVKTMTMDYIFFAAER